MNWVDATTLSLLLAQFVGVVKLLFLAGRQSAEIVELQRRVGALELYYDR